MTFYKNILVCKRELIQLQQQLMRIHPGMAAAAPAPNFKNICYRCGFYFQARSQLEAHPCTSDVRCPHCSYVFASKAGSSIRYRQANAQAPSPHHWCRKCLQCKKTYDIRDEQHQKVCEAQFVLCQDCQQKVHKANLRDHLNKCGFTRCYKCNACVYKKMLPEHLILCRNIKRTDRFNRKPAPSNKPFHYYHFKNRADADATHSNIRSNGFSPIPIVVENWLKRR